MDDFGLFFCYYYVDFFIALFFAVDKNWFVELEGVVSGVDIGF